MTTYNIKCGKSAKHNWDIYKESDELDTVFHLHNLTSPYVIIDVPINELTDEQILECSILCKNKSKHKHLNRLDVMFTSISNTKIGKVIGSFIILDERQVKFIKC